LTEGVFVNQLSNNAGKSVWWIVWVMTNCFFITDKMHKCIVCPKWTAFQT
jgi:hypothetical protein